MVILAIESSCDDTSAAVLKDGYLKANITASQAVHAAYGGVVPELASRAHEQNIVPTVDAALKKAGVRIEEVDAIGYTRGPGLMGSLMVGTSFAKGLAIARKIPLIEVDHLTAHVMAHFVNETEEDRERNPKFPFLCLLVSGGNSQILKVDAPNEMTLIGQTIDDAAGEAFDKCAKVMGLPYPGGPVVDKLAKTGDAKAFGFAKPHIAGYDYSFSGLKTSFLYTLNREKAKNPDFVTERVNDLCASLQRTVVECLMDKLVKAAKDLKIKRIAVAGGVSANSALREAFAQAGERYGWEVYIPKFSYTTDNAAMVGIVAQYKYEQGAFSTLDLPPYARVDGGKAGNR